MTSKLNTPSELDARRALNRALQAQEDELSADGMAHQILKEAEAVGVDRVYLYNPTFGSSSEMFPEHIVRRAVAILNKTGHWSARAVRVRLWHTFLLMNMNYRLHSGTPVWRIHLRAVRKAS